MRSSKLIFSDISIVEQAIVAVVLVFVVLVVSVLNLVVFIFFEKLKEQAQFSQISNIQQYDGISTCRFHLIRPFESEIACNEKKSFKAISLCL